MKAKRHKKILDIVDRQVVETQDELARELKRGGFNVTQATISRDIKELRLIKVATGDSSYRYAAPSDKYLPGVQVKAKRIFKDSLLSVDYSENLVVVKTTPGAAQSVALLIDNENAREVIGTVAGDDTVIVVVKPKTAVRKVVRKFESYMG